MAAVALAASGRAVVVPADRALLRDSGGEIVAALVLHAGVVRVWHFLLLSRSGAVTLPAQLAAARVAVHVVEVGRAHVVTRLAKLPLKAVLTL